MYIWHFTVWLLEEVFKCFEVYFLPYQCVLSLATSGSYDIYQSNCFPPKSPEWASNIAKFVTSEDHNPRMLTGREGSSSDPLGNQRNLISPCLNATVKTASLVKCFLVLLSWVIFSLFGIIRFHSHNKSYIFFVHPCSETELEDLLTTYTKLNKNASVFLGGRPERSSEESAAKVPANDTGLLRRKEGERPVSTR